MGVKLLLVGLLIVLTVILTGLIIFSVLLSEGMGLSDFMDDDEPHSYGGGSNDYSNNNTIELSDCGTSLLCFQHAAEGGGRAKYTENGELGDVWEHTLKQDCVNNICIVDVRMVTPPSNSTEYALSIYDGRYDMKCEVAISELGTLPDEMKKCYGPFVDATKEFD